MTLSGDTFNWMSKPFGNVVIGEINGGIYGGHSTLSGATFVEFLESTNHGKIDRRWSSFYGDDF